MSNESSTSSASPPGGEGDARGHAENEYPLELGRDEFRRLVELAVEEIGLYVETLPQQPAFDCEGSLDLARSLNQPIPERGVAADGLLKDLFQRVVPKGFNTASPGYFAYIPGGGILHAALADLITSAVNRYVGVWQASPGLAQIEASVIRWFCRMSGFPEGSGGILTSGGSLANFSALVAARSLRLGERFSDGILYSSSEVHHSVLKAARLAGIPEANVRQIETDDQQRIRIDLLERAIAEDRDRNLRPFFIVGNAGSTNTGAVDDLPSMGRIAAEFGVWFHVDAAYGGFFLLTDRGREVLQGIDRADSITLDPHKGLFLPYGTGCLLVRRLDDLRKAHSVQADYMPSMQSEADLVDFCEISPELSRGVRGLRIWLPVSLHGIGAFRDALDEKIDLAEFAYERLGKIPNLRILAPPKLSLVAFRWTPPGRSSIELDRLNRDLLDRIHRDRGIFLTSTRVRGEFVLRLCILSFRSHRDRVERALDAIESGIRDLS